MSEKVNTTGCHLILGEGVSDSVEVPVLDVPKYMLGLPQFESMLIVRQNPCLASYSLPINLRAEFGGLVLETNL